MQSLPYSNARLVIEFMISLYIPDMDRLYTNVNGMNEFMLYLYLPT